MLWLSALKFRVIATTIITAGVATLIAADGKSSDVLLEIDGTAYTDADVHRTNPAATFQARNALYEAERKAVDEFASAELLRREARRQNLSVDDLLAKHAYASLPKDPSEEALRVYYDGLDTSESFETVRDKIRDLVRQRRMAKAKAAYVRTLRNRAAVTIRLQAPRAPVDVGDAPVRGARGAPVTIIEYADYECPYCQQIKPVIDRLERDYKGRIAFAFKDVPLPMHASAQKAAEAAHCAGVQGKFWDYHDMLFARKQYNAADLRQYAQALGLEQGKFEQCLDSGSEAARIQAYVAEAQAIGLPGTPGFFVNGRFLNGAVDYEILRQAIEEELQFSASRAQSAASRGLE